MVSVGWILLFYVRIRLTWTYWDLLVGWFRSGIVSQRYGWERVLYFSDRPGYSLQIESDYHYQ